MRRPFRASPTDGSRAATSPATTVDRTMVSMPCRWSSPAADGLQRLRIPRAPAAVIVMMALILAGVAIVDAVSVPAKEWLARAPQTIHKIELRIRPLRSVIAQVDAVKQKADQLAEGPQAAAAPPPAPASSASYAFEMTQSLLESLTVIPLTL